MQVSNNECVHAHGMCMCINLHPKVLDKCSCRVRADGHYRRSPRLPTRTTGTIRVSIIWWQKLASSMNDMTRCRMGAVL